MNTIAARSTPAHRDGVYDLRLIDASDKQALTSCFRLRYDYFITVKKWIETGMNASGCETDDYDHLAHHLAIFHNERPIAYLRVLAWDVSYAFMLDNELACLFTEEQRRSLIRQNAVELSRLVIAPDEASPHSHTRNRQVTELLLKALYHLSLQEGYEHFYIEVETSWVKPFARRFGLPFMPIGEPYTFPDGTETIAAYASLRDLEEAVKSHSPEKYEWYRQK